VNATHLRRVLLVTIALAGGVLLTAGPAGAGNSGNNDSNDGGGNNRNGDLSIETDSGRRIAINGQLSVAADEEVDDVVLINGDAFIAGHVTGNVVVFNGDISITGEVDDNVIALNGQARLAPTAVVGGDVRSSDDPIVARGARVDGNIEETNFANIFDVVGVIFYIVWWVALTISLGILGLLFLWLAPRAAEAAVTTARTRVGASIGIGLAMFFGLAIVGLFLLLTIIGAPLGFVGLFGLVPLVALGYVTSAFFLGRLILKDSNRFLAFLLGWGILRFVELFPVLGHLVSFAAIVYGIGALTVAAWRAAHGRQDPTAAPIVREPTPTAPAPPAD
jgi:hypothetical protein